MTANFRCRCSNIANTLPKRHGKRRTLTKRSPSNSRRRSSTHDSGTGQAAPPLFEASRFTGCVECDDFGTGSAEFDWRIAMKKGVFLHRFVISSGGVLLARRTLLIALISTILALAGSAVPQTAKYPNRNG